MVLSSLSGFHFSSPLRAKGNFFGNLVCFLNVSGHASLESFGTVFYSGQMLGQHSSVFVFPMPLVLFTHLQSGGNMLSPSFRDRKEC